MRPSGCGCPDSHPPMMSLLPDSIIFPDQITPELPPWDEKLPQMERPRIKRRPCRRQIGLGANSLTATRSIHHQISWRRASGQNNRRNNPFSPHTRIDFTSPHIAVAPRSYHGDSLYSRRASVLGCAVG